MRIEIVLGVVAASMSASANAQQAVQWRTQSGGNGHWYQVVPNGPSCWEDASEQAQSRGGYLATLTSLPERDFVSALLTDESWFYLGGYQDASAEDYSEPAGGWRWVTGEAWVPMWGWPNQPDEPNEPSKVALYRAYGVHDAGPCAGGDGWRYVLEWSADCNNDGVVDKGQIIQGQLQDVNADGVPDVCQEPSCIDADIFRDFNVNGADLGILLSQWGPNTPLTRSDLNRDGVVDGSDLGIFLSFWGPCP